MALRVDPKSRVGGWLISCAATLIRILLQTVCRTYRVEVVEGQEHLDGLLSAPRPVLLSFWHNRIFLGAYDLYHRLARHGFRITALVSQSRDGEIAARVGKQWKLDVVRGSATRGGREALRALRRAIVQEGSSPIMIPDGPHGPLYEFKVGVAVLAQLSGAPILPMGLAAQRFFRIGSWDRLIVPWPFSRVAIAVGAPREIPRGLSSEELEVERQRLQDLLDELTQRAESTLGVEDIARAETNSQT